MHREVPGVESHWVETQSHAFCVSDRQSSELAQLCGPIIRKAAGLPAAAAAAAEGEDGRP